MLERVFLGGRGSFSNDINTVTLILPVTILIAELAAGEAQRPRLKF